MSTGGPQFSCISLESWRYQLFFFSLFGEFWDIWGFYPLVWLPRRVTASIVPKKQDNVKCDLIQDSHPQRPSPASGRSGEVTDTPLAEMFHATNKLPKTVKRGSIEHNISLFRPFFPLFDLLERFLFWGHLMDGRTDGRTGDFFGRQSEKALLVQQGKPSSNLTKLGLFDTHSSRPQPPNTQPASPTLSDIRQHSSTHSTTVPPRYSGRESDYQAITSRTTNVSILFPVSLPRSLTSIAPSERS